jgi:uncharacterized membrane protein
MGPLTSLVILLIFGFFVGAGVAIACYVNLTSRLRIAERDIRRLEQSLAEALRQERFRSRADAVEAPAPPIAAPPQTARPQTPPPRIERPVETSPPPPAPSSQPRPVAPAPVTAGKEAWSSLEVTIGAKWLNWVGVVLVIVGAMFFLKYAYDNNWIGPVGRIAIAAIVGAGALILGEKSRRADYPILFHTLTGCGLALFYGCIYFSFQVYGLAGQGVSFALSILVTALAVVISVLHNAPGICLLGQLGGFLSPILLSTGTNRPVELFSFVSILDLTTIGCAYRKHWRHVNAAGFIGTWFLYAGWAGRFYDVSQIEIALFFSALFYLFFLVAPTLRAFSDCKPLPTADLWLVSAGILVEFINNYALLYQNYHVWLGFVVVMQALAVAALYSLWIRHVSDDAATGQTLLLFVLALVTVAIPIQLRFYAIPIAWSLEALVLGWVGQRHRNAQFQLGALVATLLASLGLVARLPLHTAPFTPILNRPFGSWMTVITLMFVVAIVLRKNRERLAESLKPAVAAVPWLAVVLTCALAHMEISTYWAVRADQYTAHVLLSHMFTCLAILWSAIPLVFLWLGREQRIRSSVQGASFAFGIGVLLLLINTANGGWIVPDRPFLNIQWLSRVLVAVSLWIGVYWMSAVHDKPSGWEGWRGFLLSLETAGHAILAALLIVEVNSWISSSLIFSPFMRFGIVSALWSLQALILIGIGLKTRSQFRRITGFVIFGITVSKVLLIDMAILQPVYRILSFAATGVLLIVAAYLYQRFAAGLLNSERPISEASGGDPS